jgi:hypothetical protein
MSAALAPLPPRTDSADADRELREQELRRLLAEGKGHPARLRLIRSELTELERQPRG